MPTFHYLHEGRVRTLTLDRLPDGTYRALLDGRSVIIQGGAAALAGRGRLMVDGQPVRVAAASSGDLRHVTINGEATTLRRTTGGTGMLRPRPADDEAASRVCIAPMTGQVRTVLVAPGETVTRGQTLLVLEAMKMEQRVTAPADGVIARLAVTVGAVVQRGDVLIELAG